MPPPRLWATFRPQLLPQCQSSTLLRPFSTTATCNDWLTPKTGEPSKSPKGRPAVRTNGSTKGTTVIWGDYGLRMVDHDRRLSAASLKIGEDTIRKRLRGMKFRLYMRLNANVGVYTSGNEQRMGKGKGSFDYWCARVAVSRVIFELKGEVHEQVVRDAFRLCGNKMPGQYEFVRRGDPPVMGLTKLGDGVTAEDLKRPRRKLPLEETAARIPAASEGSVNPASITV